MRIITIRLAMAWVFFLSVTVIGCSGSLDPVLPDDLLRFCSDFESPWALWDNGLASIQCKEVDLSAMVYAGPDTAGTLDYPVTLDGDHWTVATTIQKNHASSPPSASIRYAWLDDSDSPTNGPAASEGVVYTAGRTEEIAAAKVAAMH